jgi:hypothetical protein
MPFYCLKLGQHADAYRPRYSAPITPVSLLPDTSLRSPSVSVLTKCQAKNITLTREFHLLAESTFEDSDKHIHSTGDTMDYEEFSFDHMKEFSKLAIAFGVELSGHKSK